MDTINKTQPTFAERLDRAFNKKYKSTCQEKEPSAKEIRDLINALKKSVVQAPEASIDLDLHSESSISQCLPSDWLRYLEQQLDGFSIGEAPREIFISNGVELCLVQSGMGLYSGFCRTEMGTFKLENITIPSLLQTLITKGLVKN